MEDYLKESGNTVANLIKKTLIIRQQDAYSVKLHELLGQINGLQVVVV